MSWRAKWVSEKRDIALRLSSGDCGGSYGEAMLVLCAAMSALAAEVWPGKRIDQKRFSELLNDYAPPSLDATHVSVPVLVWHLQNTDRATESQGIRTAWLNFSQTRVITGKDVDQTEHEIALRFPTIPTKDLRECSYANILYREVRSAYAHEYRPGSRADSWSMTSDCSVPVSYINRVTDPNRLVHFRVEWVADLVLAVAQSVDRATQTIPHALPTKWWLEG